jgi:outer membrane protein OmpA-like peptidoglycan-associated protein
MKKLSLSLIMLLFFTSLSSWGQATNEEEIQLNFYDGEFFLAEEDYRDALQAFLKVYEAGYQDNANINYRIGICYLNIPGEKEKAVPYLEKAVTKVSKNYREGNFKEETAPPDAYLFLGNAYRIAYQLDKSIEAYESYIEISEANTQELQYAKNEIEACKRAKEAIKDPAELNKENIGGLYNSAFNNFNTVLAYNGSAMAYMSEQRFYDAIYYMEIVNGRFTNPNNITPQIESDGDQYVTALSYDGTKMLLTKVSSFDADIMVSNYEARRWSKSENLGKPVNSKFFESHASFSPDGKTIFFASNRKESLGGMDIFYSELNEDGEWSEPKNLGPTVNTALNEDTPFMCRDGIALFFSSQGHETIGGYDIFYTVKDDQGNWTKPQSLPYPLNTTDDDLFFFPTCIAGEGISGYMTLIEPEGLGSGDIYRVSLETPELAVEEEPEEPVIEVVEEEIAEEVIEVTEPALEPEVEKIEEAAEIVEKAEEVLAEETKQEEMRMYKVKPIFFRFDSYELSSNAIEKLDEIAEVMKSYEQIKLEIQGHTDAMGPDVYNQYLSEKRAESVKNYLVSKGVSESRLTTIGLSESLPAAINSNPDGSDNFLGRKLNRRVEFELDPGIMDEVEVEPVDVPENLKIK